MTTSKQNTKATQAASKPSQARKTAAKATGKGTGRKPATKRQAAPKQPKVHTAYGSEDKKSPYSIFGNHEALAAYTIAALRVSGMLNLTAKGAPSIGKARPLPNLARMLIGKRAWAYWSKLGRIEGGKLTAKGLNEVQARLSGNSRGYNTSLDTVQAFVSAMQKGGQVKLGEGKIYRLSVRHGSTS